MGYFTRANSFKIKKMVLGLKNIWMDLSIKDFGNKIKGMVEECYYFLIFIKLKDNGTKIK
jgi:hypothetical protein